MPLRFLRRNIYGHVAIMVPILWLRLWFTNPKTEKKKRETIELQINGMQIYFVIKQTFLLCY